MKIQCIAALPWTSYEKRRALNICLKTNCLLGRSSSGQSFVTEKNYSKNPHIRTYNLRVQAEHVLVL